MARLLLAICSEGTCPSECHTRRRRCGRREPARQRTTRWPTKNATSTGSATRLRAARGTSQPRSCSDNGDDSSRRSPRSGGQGRLRMARSAPWIERRSTHKRLWNRVAFVIGPALDPCGRRRPPAMRSTRSLRPLPLGVLCDRLFGLGPRNPAHHFRHDCYLYADNRRRQVACGRIFCHRKTRRGAESFDRRLSCHRVVRATDWPAVRPAPPDTRCDRA